MKNVVVQCSENDPLRCSSKPSCIAVNLQSRLYFSGRHEQDSCWSWLVCFCAAIANIVVVGLSYSYGILFPVLLEYFNLDRATTAWVGSAFSAASFLFGPLAANLCNLYGCRLTAISGAVLCVLGLLLTSQSPSIYTMFISFSLVTGFGCCCVYTACFVSVPRMFRRRRSLAVAIISLGPGGGIMVIAPIMQCLVDSFGWRKTFLVLAGITGLTSLLCSTFDSTTLKDLRESNLSLNNTDEVYESGVDTSIFRNKRYNILLVTSIILFLGLHNVQVYLVEFSGNLHVTANDASILYFYIGVFSSISRSLSGSFCDFCRINPVYIVTTGTTIAGTSIILLSHATTYIHLVVFSACYGISEGVMVVVPILLLNSVSRRQRGFAYGMFLFLTAFPFSIAPPFIGFLTDTFDSYSPGFYFSGICVITSGFWVLLLLVVGENKSKSERIEITSSSTVEAFVECTPIIEKMTVV